jgi:hypothetical protein
MSVRIVKTVGEQRGPDTATAEAFLRAAARVAADNLIGAVIISEHTIGPGKVETRIECVPASQAMSRGLVEEAYEMFYPAKPDAE